MVNYFSYKGILSKNKFTPHKKWLLREGGPPTLWHVPPQNYHSFWRRPWSKCSEVGFISHHEQAEKNAIFRVSLIPVIPKNDAETMWWEKKSWYVKTINNNSYQYYFMYWQTSVGVKLLQEENEKGGRGFSPQWEKITLCICLNLQFSR